MRRLSEAWRRWLRVAPLALVVGLLGWMRAAEVQAGETGVVVEEVAEESALEKAGLRPGDVVWAWERLPNTPASPERVHRPPLPRSSRPRRCAPGPRASAPFYWAAFQVIGDWQ